MKAISISLKQSLIKYALILSLPLLFVLHYGCTLSIKPTTEPLLEQLSSYSISQYSWDDDLEFDGIKEAIEQSLVYFRRLPSSHSFNYGETSYSPEDMISSLNLFLHLIKNYQGKELAQQLSDKFLYFESKNADGRTFFTGYYEPVLQGSLSPTAEFSEPLYETPEDLVEVDLGMFSDKWVNEKVVGRIQGNQLVPFDSREDIVYRNSLADRAKPIAYVNGIELFFLQIQGSGLISLPDGTIKRVNYAQKNGHPYRSIGKFLKEKISPKDVSLQSIKEYLYSHPDEVKEILSYNQSYVFFREVEEGPLGDIEVPLTPGRSIAMDRRVIPRGSLAFIENELPVFEDGMIINWKLVKRFAVVQDTGGAIRDHGRVDLFQGNGNFAEQTAGLLKNNGRTFLLVARKEYIQ